MCPPQWVHENAERLSLDEFVSLFSSTWERIESRFLKVECWQSYHEIAASASQKAYKRGDNTMAKELLRQEAELDKPLYQDVVARGIEYARIRLVQLPLTNYLKYELLAYQIRIDMGETIEFVRCDSRLRLPNTDFFDFLLFDRHTALIHDYGKVGRQAGGWVSRDPNVLTALERTALTLRAKSVSWQEFGAGLQ
jgi:hypothetical protein